MATQIWCEMVCSDCSKLLSAMFTTGSVPRADLKKEAFAKGTQKVEHGLFVGLDCAIKAYDADMRACASKQGGIQ